jgi:alkanesulfonate monooxygenase SsuD/methylene tetrahydromethanopterin reductase-like flavin-dependent oxidoreductase (luciferase family)
MAIKVGMAVVPYLSIQQQVQSAVMLEKLGFDSAWWPDHILFTDQANGYDAWTVMAVAASRTSKIQIGTAVTDPHRVHPAVFAQRAATLDQLSRGRLMLGLGSGESMNLDPFGIAWQDRKVGRTREFIKVVRALLDHQEPQNHTGQLFQLKNANLAVRPYKNRHIPIYMASLGPQMQKLTGEVADGWLPVIVPPEHYAGYFEPIAASARLCGRQPEQFERIATVLLCILPDGTSVSDAQLAKIFRPYAGTLVWGVSARQLGLPFDPPEHLAEVGYQTVNPCDPDSVQLFKDFTAWVPDETFLKFTLVGDRQTVLKALKSYVAAGVTHFEMMNASPDPLWSAGVIAHQFIPELTGRAPTLAARALNLASPLLLKSRLGRRLVPAELDRWTGIV